MKFCSRLQPLYFAIKRTTAKVFLWSRGTRVCLPELVHSIFSQHLGEHQMPRPLVGVCHERFWWDSHLWRVRLYPCRAPPYVCLRQPPCQGAEPKRVSIVCSCFLQHYGKVLSNFKCFHKKFSLLQKCGLKHVEHILSFSVCIHILSRWKY